MTRELHQDDLFDGAPCRCGECERLDREDGLRSGDARLHSQLRLPLSPLPHLAGQPTGFSPTEMPS